LGLVELRIGDLNCGLGAANPQFDPQAISRRAFVNA
jgi:hypothetical protein